MSTLPRFDLNADQIWHAKFFFQVVDGSIVESRSAINGASARYTVRSESLEAATAVVEEHWAEELRKEKIRKLAEFDQGVSIDMGSYGEVERFFSMRFAHVTRSGYLEGKRSHFLELQLTFENASGQCTRFSHEITPEEWYELCNGQTIEVEKAEIQFPLAIARDKFGIEDFEIMLPPGTDPYDNLEIRGRVVEIAKRNEWKHVSVSAHADERRNRDNGLCIFTVIVRES